MPSLTNLLKPKYLVVALLSLLGFVLMFMATGKQINLGFKTWLFPDMTATRQLIAFVAGLAIMIGATIFLYNDFKADPVGDVKFGEPAFAHFLFFNTRSAPLWLGIRLYLGFQWLAAGWHKAFPEEGTSWFKDGGAALHGYWQHAIYVPTPEEAAKGMRPAISYDGWREFITYMDNHGWYSWFAKLITLGELAVGVALILGALTAWAAAGGAIMNMSFLLSGSASSNPVLLSLAILIILAWRVAGWIGLDRWIIPALGTPWQTSVPLDAGAGTKLAGYGAGAKR